MCPAPAAANPTYHKRAATPLFAGWRRSALMLQYAAFPVLVLILWQVFSSLGFVRRNVLPPPSDVIAVWYDLVTGATDVAARYSGTWLDHAWASIWRVFPVFAWGVSLGIFFGLIIGLSPLTAPLSTPSL